MDKKFFTLILISSLTAGAVSFAVSASQSHASFLDDLFKLVPKINIEQNQKKLPTEPILNGQPTINTNQLSREAQGYEDAVVSAVEKASPSVVSIVISKDLPVYERCKVDNPFSNLSPEFQQIFGNQGYVFTEPCQKGTKKQEIGGGTGFVVSSDGLILTNRHVVADKAASYVVLTNDGKKYNAKVLDRSPVEDLALIKIEANNLPVIILGDSDGVKLGQTAIVIGNALAEYRNTVSVGVISGLARNITAADAAGLTETIQGVIQTDAAINPGNSGGPLLNLRGEVIGINAAIDSGAQNIGFAIPINQAKHAIESVKKNGKIIIPYLGVRYLAITNDLASKEKLPVTAGALLRGGSDGPAVVPQSPADKAGLQAEDIVTEVNRKKVSETSPLGTLIQRYNVGDTVTFKIVRKGKEMSLNIVLAERPAEK